MESQIVDYVKAALVNTTVLQPFILALVTLYGKFGLSGKAQLAGSLLTGFVFGALGFLASFGVPAELSGWFALVLFGLIPGLVASGVYEVGRDIAEKAALG